MANETPENDMNTAWVLFRTRNESLTAAERENKWFDLIASVAPGKDQIDLTDSDWQQIINKINKLNN